MSQRHCGISEQPCGKNVVPIGGEELVALWTKLKEAAWLKKEELGEDNLASSRTH